MDRLNLNDLLSSDPKVKYSCTKRAIEISDNYPFELYPDLDVFIGLLDNKNNILKWTAILVVGNLSYADRNNKTVELIPKLIGFLNCGKMITANNSIKALTEIALNKPEFRDEIIREIIKVEKYNYDTTECRNVAIGQAIKALENFKDEIGSKRSVMNFLKRQESNTRASVARRATKLLGKMKK